jgi:hypothetical protein
VLSLKAFLQEAISFLFLFLEESEIKLYSLVRCNSPEQPAASRTENLQYATP